ncbi:hypothetical protein SB748_28955 [Rhizobium sp. SIMBA_035]
MKTYASRPKPETAIRKYRPRGNVQAPKLSSLWSDLIASRMARASAVDAPRSPKTVPDAPASAMRVTASCTSPSAERNR